MNLAELIIEVCDHTPDDLVLNRGLFNPHSERGWYDHLAFDLGGTQPISDTRRVVLSAVDATYPGWKGGTYQMTATTPVWLVDNPKPGTAGEQLTHGWIRSILADSALQDRRRAAPTVTAADLALLEDLRATLSHRHDDALTRLIRDVREAYTITN